MGICGNSNILETVVMKINGATRVRQELWKFRLCDALCEACSCPENAFQPTEGCMYVNGWQTAFLRTEQTTKREYTQTLIRQCASHHQGSLYPRWRLNSVALFHLFTVLSKCLVTNSASAAYHKNPSSSWQNATPWATNWPPFPLIQHSLWHIRYTMSAGQFLMLHFHKQNICAF